MDSSTPGATHPSDIDTVFEMVLLVSGVSLPTLHRSAGRIDLTVAERLPAIIDSVETMELRQNVEYNNGSVMGDRAAQKQAILHEGNYVLSENRVSRTAMKLYYALPQRLRLYMLDRILRNPFRRKNMMGTAVVTSVGTAGNLPGWIIPKSMHNLCFALDSIVKKPRVVENEIRVRDVLHLTILFDHDVVDGIPAARFAAKLVERIEEGS